MSNPFEKLIRVFGKVARPNRRVEAPIATPKVRSTKRRSRGRRREETVAGTRESIASYVESTRQAQRSATVSSDQRMRLRGRHTFDICATPERIGTSIEIFEALLGHLASRGISLETRFVDGWRYCAVVGGTPIPLRIRERLHRVQPAARVSVAIESLLGGKLPERLVPSGKLEIQVLRFGVAVESFEVGLPLSELNFEEVEASIREVAEREQAHQQRMLASAMAQAQARQRPFLRETAKPIASVADAAPQARELPAPRMSELTMRLDQLIAQYQGSGIDVAGSAGAMSSSVVSLFNVLGNVADNTPSKVQLSGPRKVTRKPERQRCVA